MQLPSHLTDTHTSQCFHNSLDVLVVVAVVKIAAHLIQAEHVTARARPLLHRGQIQRAGVSAGTGQLLQLQVQTNRVQQLRV